MPSGSGISVNAVKNTAASNMAIPAAFANFLFMFKALTPCIMLQLSCQLFQLDKPVIYAGFPQMKKFSKLRQ